MKILSLVVALGLLATPLLAQESTPQGQPQKVKFAPTPENSLLDGRTIVKTNVLALAFGIPNLGVERILSPGLSATLSFHYRPTSSETVYNNAYRSFSYTSDVTKTGFLRFTPTLRWYLKGGQGHGFYLEGQYELARLMPADTYTSLEPSFSNRGSGPELYGRERITAHTFGVALGAQWLFGRKKNIVLDWCILGVGTGVGYHSADFKIIGRGSSQPLAFTTSEALLSSLRQSSDLNLDGAKVTITDQNLRARLTGAKSTAYTYRMGLSLGFRF